MAVKAKQDKICEARGQESTSHRDVSVESAETLSRHQPSHRITFVDITDKRRGACHKTRRPFCCVSMHSFSLFSTHDHSRMPGVDGVGETDIAQNLRLCWRLGGLLSSYHREAA
jgi:hypothetical protein